MVDTSEGYDWEQVLLFTVDVLGLVPELFGDAGHPCDAISSTAQRQSIDIVVSEQSGTVWLNGALFPGQGGTHQDLRLEN